MSHYFCVTFSHLGLAHLSVFNLTSSNLENVNTLSFLRAEGNVNSRSNKPFNCAGILDCERIGCKLKSFLFIRMVEFDHCRSTAKTYSI